MANVNVGGHFVYTEAGNEWVWDPAPTVTGDCSWVQYVGLHPSIPNTQVYAVYTVVWAPPVRSTVNGQTCAEVELLG